MISLEIYDLIIFFYSRRVGNWGIYVDLASLAYRVSLKMMLNWSYFHFIKVEIELCFEHADVAKWHITTVHLNSFSTLLYQDALKDIISDFTSLTQVYLFWRCKLKVTKTVQLRRDWKTKAFSTKLRMSTEPKNESTSANSSQVELSNSGKIFTSLAAGGIAGGIAKTVIAPLDRY